MIELLDLSQIVWIIGNIVIAYVAFALVVFVVGYYALFDPSATTAGKLLFRFMLSLVGIMLLAYLGVFLFPTTGSAWHTLPPTVTWWWPLLRLVVYGYIAFAITSLAILLVLRKWFPKRIKSAPDKSYVKVRHDTEEIDIVKPKDG